MAVAVAGRGVGDGVCDGVCDGVGDGVRDNVGVTSVGRTRRVGVAVGVGCAVGGGTVPKPTVSVAVQPGLLPSCP